MIVKAKNKNGSLPSLFLRPTNAQNIYINNISYIVSTPTHLNASASSSGRLNLVLCLSYKIMQYARMMSYHPSI